MSLLVPGVRPAIARWPDDAPRGAPATLGAEQGISRKDAAVPSRARARAEGQAAVPGRVPPPQDQSDSSGWGDRGPGGGSTRVPGGALGPGATGRSAWCDKMVSMGLGWRLQWRPWPGSLRARDAGPRRAQQGGPPGRPGAAVRLPRSRTPAGSRLHRESSWTEAASAWSSSLLRRSLPPGGGLAGRPGRHQPRGCQGPAARGRARLRRAPGSPLTEITGPR